MSKHSIKKAANKPVNKEIVQGLGAGIHWALLTEVAAFS